MQSEVMLEKAVKHLSDNLLSNIDMIEPLKRGMADILYADDDGVILFERNSQACMISMHEIEKCKSILDLKKYRLFAVHDENIAKWIWDNGNFSNKLVVYQAAYNKMAKIHIEDNNISPLSYDNIDLVCRHYTSINDRKYIEKLIDRHQLWGIFEDGALAGFIGEHLEGSMGLLEVLPEYRRKGYGFILEAFMINRFLKLNMTPFCQVVTNNTASLALQQKIGMDISSQTTIWIFD
ncbi:MAG: GNAT family N-acetyltransferase [Clostridiaceae bacterium]|nr:GNAT family N-acetyltransferase [Clostridiaceae bacterium]